MFNKNLLGFKTTKIKRLKNNAPSFLLLLINLYSKWLANYSGWRNVKKHKEDINFVCIKEL